MKKLTFVKYSGKSLKHGIFDCVKNSLWVKDCGNIKFYQEILTDGDYFIKHLHIDLKASELFLAIDPISGESIAMVMFIKDLKRQAEGLPWVLISTYVKPKHRCKKVGTRLLRYAKLNTRCKKFYSITSRRVGQMFYKKNGIKT